MENEIDEVVASFPIYFNAKLPDSQQQQLSIQENQLLLLTFPTSGLVQLPIKGKKRKKTSILLGET
jgi:hypothetical protein